MFNEKTLNGGRKMGWLIIAAVAFFPIIYRIHRRLDYLEKEIKRLNGENE